MPRSRGRIGPVSRLRAAAENAPGERFDIRDFRRVLLGQGLPPTTLGEVIAVRIAERS